MTRRQRERAFFAAGWAHQVSGGRELAAPLTRPDQPTIAELGDARSLGWIEMRGARFHVTPRGAEALRYPLTLGEAPADAQS